MRDDFREIIRGWTLILDDDDAALRDRIERIERIGQWLHDGNLPMQPDEEATVALLMRTRFERGIEPEKLSGHRTIACPRCGRVSYNPFDMQHRYCEACHAFHPGVTSPGTRPL